MKTFRIRLAIPKAALAALACCCFTSFAALPVVKTVPWVDSAPLIPHTTYPAKSIRLKGACDVQGANIQYTWDFGDGTPVSTGTVTDKYAIEASHTYGGAVGTVYTARLTVKNTTTGEQAFKFYYVTMQTRTLETEVNIAIDEGLWYLHKTIVRTTVAGPEGAVPAGYWNPNWWGLTAANVNAFEVNGHKETGSADNPYTETVARGLALLFSKLTTRAVPNQTNPLGTFSPDSNLNGLGVYLSQSYPYYQGGMVMDAIVASGTPNATTRTAPGVLVGRTYSSIVQDMVDDHAWAQYDGTAGGGWRYNANEYPDNSACQWAAIGMLAAERNWGLTVPLIVKQWNVKWLFNTQAANGSFGYVDTSPAWGPYATTPSGMVQMVLDGFGRGISGAGWPSWDKAETFIRNNFGNGGGAANAIKDYYYGLFSFVKSMLLYPYDPDAAPGVGPAKPIVWLQSSTAGVPPLDWYAAQVSQGAPTDGVARTLIGDQNTSGYWTGHNYTGDQYAFETAWAIMMLHRTLFESGVPVAVGKAIPNPAVVGQTITLDGSDSFHQDSAKDIVAWEWDLDSNGTFETSGVIVTTTFGATGNYPVKLRVRDSATSPATAESVVTIVVDTPPLPPTADADGPYTFCASIAKWFLNGYSSTNPDEGQSEPGQPADTIVEYAWDLDGDLDYNDAFGPAPDVKAFFAGYSSGSYLIALRVTDNTALAYPSSGFPNLASTSTSEIRIVDEADAECSCIVLTATPLVKDVRLDWSEYPGAHHYNVYRGSAAGGPYLWVGSSETLTYTDSPGVLNQVHHYVVRPAEANGDNICQSNEASAEPLHPAPVAACVPSPQSNLGKFYYRLGATSESFGRAQLQIFVGDTLSGLVAGPYTDQNIVRIRNASAATVRPGTGGIAALITVKGQAKVWAKDPIGQIGNVIVFTP